MAGITIAQAQASLDALVLASQTYTGKQKVKIQTSAGSREVEYASLGDLTEAINYWSRVLAGLERSAAGASRHGAALADFRSVS